MYNRQKHSTPAPPSTAKYTRAQLSAQHTKPKHSTAQHGGHESTKQSTAQYSTAHRSIPHHRAKGRMAPPSTYISADCITIQHIQSSLRRAHQSTRQYTRTHSEEYHSAEPAQHVKAKHKAREHTSTHEHAEPRREHHSTSEQRAQSLLLKDAGLLIHVCQLIHLVTRGSAGHVSWACPGSRLGLGHVSWACPGRVLGVSWVCPGRVLGVSWIALN
jgi:hypothetical protein